MSTKTIVIAFLAACCLVPTSCQLGPDGSGEVDSRQFKDVVVPAGFRLRDVAHESYSREEATWRHGHFIYAGSTDAEDASSYVQRRMPQHSWMMVREEVEEIEEGEDDSGIRLRFERGVYSADYHFTRRAGMTHMVVDYSTDYSRR